MKPILTAILRLYTRLIYFAFRLLYYEMAWTYDLVANLVSLGNWWEWQRQALPHLPASGPILELGHGTGHLLEELIQRGNTPIGLDLSPYMGQIAQRRLARRGYSPPLLRGNVQALPLASGSIPAIVATFPTEYIVDPIALRQFWRVLQPGGRVVFIPTSVLSGTTIFIRFIRWLFYITGQTTHMADDPIDDSPGWPGNIRAAYAAAGFDTHIQYTDLPHSRVYIVIADKPPG